MNEKLFQVIHHQTIGIFKHSNTYTDKCFMLKSLMSTHIIIILRISRRFTTWCPLWISPISPVLYLVFICSHKTGDGSSFIQNAVCKRNSSTNQLMRIRHLRSTCEASRYVVLGKRSYPVLLLTKNALYVAARANHTFSQIQQGVLWHLFTVESTARIYHPWSSN